MARIRTVKPEFFTSEDIVELSSFARLLYIALWCESDREGRFVWKPKTFKIRYFPVDPVDIDELCEELINRGLVKLYGDGLAYIPKFLDHQHVNPRESASILPSPDNASPRVEHASPRDSDVQVGKEGKGKIETRENVHALPLPKPSKQKSNKTSLPIDFGISDRVSRWAADKGHGDLDVHLESFVIKCRANGYKYIDWDDAFMNAIRDNWAKIPPKATGTNGSWKNDKDFA